MSAHLRRMHWEVLLTFALSLASPTVVRAEQSKGDELKAEAKQAAEEDAQEQSERAKGKTWQHMFSGTFRRIWDPETAQALSPEVVGTFVTSLSDKKPGRSYLVKAEGKELLDALNRSNGKIVKFRGKLRNIGPDGEAKYLVVSDVVLETQTTPAVEHRAFGGI